MSMYRIVHKESGKEATVEVKGFDRDEMIKQASEKIGINISPTEVGHIRILPL
jgi:hypothetical protein|tara:strand:- start:96 stop:254 length:159 start_codon:yes stop_codon:yes gene_type:complete